MSRDVKVNLEPLRRFAATVERDLRRGGNGPVRNAVRQWAVRFRSFLQERFDRLSKSGGGEWAPLKASTKRRRRKGKGRTVKARGKTRTFAQGTVSILRDTGTLFGALHPQFTHKPGQLQQDIPMGVRVGYGGPAKHPGGKASIADIAHFHQVGNLPHLPARPIIVDPDQHTVNQMARDMERALIQANRDATR